MSRIALGDMLDIWFSYCPSTIDKVRLIPGRKWDMKFKHWSVPVSLENYKTLLTILPKPITIDQSVDRWYVDKLKEVGKDEMDIKSLIQRAKEYSFKLKPYAHQRASFEAAILSQSLGLFLECGLGKSAIALNIIQFYLFFKVINRALVVLPLSVANTWRSEIEKHTDITSVEFLTDMTISKRKERLLNTDKKLYIVNYDALPKMQTDIIAKGFQLIVADESTFIKSYKALRTKAILNIARNIKYRFAMTGTVFGQRVMDCYSQLKFTAPEKFPESFFSFRNKYCEMGGYKGKEITGNKNMPELEARIKGVAKIYRKVDCLDLPELIYETRTCELTGEQEVHYKEMLEYLFTIVKGDTVVNVTSVLVQMLKLSQIVDGFIFSNMKDGDTEGKLLILKENPKLKLLQETLEEVSGKVVIFCKFRYDVQIIKSVLGDTCVEFTGDTNPKERDEAIKRFNDDPNCKYFLATSCGGYGINLQIASTAIFYSHEYSVEKRVQAESRVHRNGSKLPVTIIDLIATRDCKQTIDGYVVKACKEKRDITSALVDAIKNKEL